MAVHPAVYPPRAQAATRQSRCSTSPITRDAVTPQGVTAAWWPLRCMFGSPGAGAKSPLSRLQFARSRLAPRASGWLNPAVDPDPRPSAEMRVAARTRDATPTTTGHLHRCLRRYGLCIAPDGSPSSGAGSGVFGSDVAASTVSALARGAATPFSARSTGSGVSRAAAGLAAHARRRRRRAAARMPRGSR
jgi:hypothetical protein